ncbi:restriction endonuclease subunit S [Cereibacter sediminicola]|uniref:restriction endonuclease subunit S n=1 Tax=Cereibacter sediminicola TaxID=2584941 RepID=UPI00119E9269|nr:restriction endonuclease subunit S [Cereibacter sediminicola]
MRRYSAYKDSGVEWLGEVPEGWEVVPLKRVASIRYGIGEPPAYQETGTPLIRATNVDAGTISVDGLVFVNPADIPPARILWLAPGDIIVVRSGAYTGDSAIIREEHCPAIAGFDMVVTPKGADPDFLQYALLSAQVKVFQLDLLRMRAAQPHLNSQELGDCGIPLPTLSEQQAIAAFLDRETAKIDALVEEQRRLIALLAEKRQAVISHAVTRGLNPDAPLKPSGIDWLGDIPEGWEVVPTGYRYEVQLGRMLNEARSSGDDMRPYLRVFDVQWGQINVDDLPLMDFPPEARSRYRLRSGDLLVNEGGSYVGRSAIWRGELEECYYQKALHRLRPRNTNKDTAEFFYYVMDMATRRNVFIAGGNQTTIDHLTAEQLRGHRFAFPPMDEQLTIADYLAEELPKLDALTSTATSAITLLQERRAALISAAVTGKIDVRDLSSQSLPECLEPA